jgi:hypothetical protein
MVYARMYPSKSTIPEIVRVERHITRDIKGVRCVMANRYPFHVWPITGEWIPSDHGFVQKRALFDLRSDRVIEGINHGEMVPEEMSLCLVGQ